jgi:hypothetical protein
MAARGGGGGDSKQGLVVALVLFVLLSIILGLTTYFGYSEAGKAQDEAKKADAKFKDKDKEADWYKFQAWTYRAYMGYPIAASLDDLTTLRGQYNNGTGGLVSGNDKFKDDNVKFLQDTLEKPLGWDDKQKKPVKTFEGEVSRLAKELRAANAQVKQTQDLLADANKKLAAKEDELKAARDEFEAKYAKLNKDREADRKDYDDKLRVLRDQLEGITKEKGEALLAGDKAKEGFTKDLAKKDREMRQMGEKIVKLEEQVPKLSRVDIDQPKGKIFRMNADGQTPYIDLGSADGLKPQVTFSVHGVGPDGKPLKEPKASLEVIRIMGDHLAQARITGVQDPGRDPVMPGDYLFNPAWDPRIKQHVAVAGLIDLTGTGTDNTLEFIRTLQQQGVIVDAYLDPKTQKEKGDITRQTDYLILGTSPEFTGDVRAGETKTEKKSETISAITAMQDKASKQGVTIIKLKDFLALSGYRLPKSATGANASRNLNFRRPSYEQSDAPKMSAPGK